MALKKKKMYESQLEQVDNNIARVNEQQLMLENQRSTAVTVLALSDAAKASKATMQEMKIENVDKVLDEINDTNDQMAQISDAMAQPIGAAADLDEDELMGELEVRHPGPHSSSICPRLSMARKPRPQPLMVPLFFQRSMGRLGCVCFIGNVLEGRQCLGWL
jgi:Snf7